MILISIPHVQSQDFDIDLKTFSGAGAIIGVDSGAGAKTATVLSVGLKIISSSEAGSGTTSSVVVCCTQRWHRTAASMAPVNGATFCVNACCSNCNRGFSSVSLSHCYNRGTTYGSGLKEQRWNTRINKRITTWPRITKWTKAHHGVARSIYPGTEALQAV